MPSTSKLYWIVAAGTGGHIFPGLSVADEIKKREPESEFLFFGTRERLEAKLVPQHGYPIFFLNAKQWKGRGPLSRALALLSLLRGIFQVWGQILAKRPRCLISVGGYVSVPTALACRFFGVPLFLIEPNIRAGLANRLLSRVARAAFCPPGADAMQLFKCPTFDAGNPVRGEIKIQGSSAEVKKILVLGGSQGALALCDVAVPLMKKLAVVNPQVVMTLQTGEKNLAATQAKVQAAKLDKTLHVVPFIASVAQAFEAHQIVIARAGAMTLAELSIAALPTILVPFPFAADDHQRFNARLLEKDAAVLLVDEKEPDFAANLEKKLLSLLEGAEGRSRRSELSKNFQKWARPRAGVDIVDKILKKL